MENILKLITNYWVMAFITAMVLYFLLKIWNYLLEQTFKKVDPPYEHMFFTNINKHIEFKIPTVKLFYHDMYAEGRTKIFCNMLSIKFKIWSTKLREATYKKWDLNTIYQNTLIDIYHWYLIEWKEKDIPEVVIDKFNEWHQPLIELYQKSIEDICSSKWYSSRIEKENAILEISNAMVVFTVLDWEKTLGSLNWELTGLKYKDKIII